MKKMVALLLALVMVFSLCASAGATNAQTATLTVSYCSELLLNESIMLCVILSIFFPPILYFLCDLV